MPFADPDEDPLGDLDPHERNTGEDSLLTGLRTGAWLDQQEFEPLQWVVEGIIPEGTSILAGAPKTGKSWLMLAVALAVATGGRALGYLPVGGARPVFYLALEDSDRRMQDRCRTVLGPGVPIPDNLNYLTEVKPGTCVATVLEWLESYGARRPLVIVDTLGRIMPSSRNGETTYQRDYRTVAELQSAVSPYPGTGLTIVHHTRKMGSEDFGDRISGTQGLLGAADSGLVLTRSRTEAKGTLSVTGRDVEEAEYGLALRDGLWLLDGTTLATAKERVQERKVTEKLSDRSADIYRYVASAGKPVGPTEVAKKFGMPAGDAGNYLIRMANSGRIVKVARGQYTVSTLSTVSTQVPKDASNVIPLRGVENVETVEMPGQKVSTGECDRCGFDTDELILGRCRNCAYPAGGAPEGDDE